MDPNKMFVNGTIEVNEVNELNWEEVVIKLGGGGAQRKAIIC